MRERNDCVVIHCRSGKQSALQVILLESLSRPKL